ncbi:GcpE protein [Salmonella enterica subsp. enterica]|uniref:GcpE protein n=1 Tax=Salmonella enterica I TaxID=59201 RepID=A0A447TY34_SALET|nr:GcpE protein [Salmonella enterica subsp. enterica]
MHNQAPIQRRKSTRIYVGNVPIGDGAPIAVQSMTNTRTTDVEATVNQIKALERVWRRYCSCFCTDHGRRRSVLSSSNSRLTSRWLPIFTSTTALR